MGEYNYSGEHSATFGEKNTWNDWKLVPTSLLIPSAPQPKTEFVDIPGADGQLDYTEVLAGIKYQPRQGSFEFYVMNGFSSWAERYSEVMAYLHGKRMRLVISDDPNYYYMGRFAVNEYQSDEHWSKLVIDYVLDPYKLPVSGTADYDWLWFRRFLAPHGDREIRHSVIGCKKHTVRTHHHIVSDGNTGADQGVDTDSGVVSDPQVGGELRSAFNVYIIPTGR
jgi:hypothetical protein